METKTQQQYEPYPQCGDCKWAPKGKGPGCGFVGSRMPCGHPVERRRFEATAEGEGDEAPCPLCGGTVGHRVNCPDGIAFSEVA
jgi:hypothetical protein